MCIRVRVVVVRYRCYVRCYRWRLLALRRLHRARFSTRLDVRKETICRYSLLERTAIADCEAVRQLLTRGQVDTGQRLTMTVVTSCCWKRITRSHQRSYKSGCCRRLVVGVVSSHWGPLPKDQHVAARTRYVIQPDRYQAKWKKGTWSSTVR